MTRSETTNNIFNSNSNSTIDTYTHTPIEDTINNEDENFLINEDLITKTPTTKPTVTPTTTTTTTTTSIDLEGLLTPPLCLYEDAQKGCGGHLWPAGMVLAKYLSRPEQVAFLKGKRIIELGAGSGLVGLSVARALSSSSPTNLSSSSSQQIPPALAASVAAHEYQDQDHETHPTHQPHQAHRQTKRTEKHTRIHLTDQEPMLPLLNRNCTLNSTGGFGAQVTASVLNWGSDIPHPLFPSIEDARQQVETPPHVDVILAAECVYLESAFTPLLQTLGELIGDGTVCFLAFKKRRKADLRFLNELKKSFEVKEVDDDPDKDKWRRERIFFFKVLKKIT